MTKKTAVQKVKHLPTRTSPPRAAKKQRTIDSPLKEAPNKKLNFPQVPAPAPAPALNDSRVELNMEVNKLNPDFMYPSLGMPHDDRYLSHANPPPRD